MNTRCFAAVAIPGVAIVVWLGFVRLSAAGETSTSSNPAAAAPVQLSSSAEDILKLSRAKVSDDVTVVFVQNSDRCYNLTASEILYLRNEGVSDRVLTAMLSQQPPVADASPASAPARTREVSAPEYITPPATTATVETTPVSTVYLETTPTYYSFYDPWPYWYPALSLGLYWGWSWGWGSCYYGSWGYPYCYNRYWNNYCHNGYYPPPPNGHPWPPNGTRPPPPNGNPPPPGGRLGQSATLASTGRQPSSANSTVARSDSTRVGGKTGGTATTGRPTSYWSNNGSQPATARPTASPTRAASSRNPQATSPTSLSANGATSRSVTAGPNQTRGAAQSIRNGRSPASPTSVATYNRPSSPYTSRYVASPSASYSRNAFSPSYSYRGGGSFSSASRPSISPSFSSPRSSSAFRGGGGFSGGGSPRMSSGGGFRGGGGGGRSR